MNPADTKPIPRNWPRIRPATIHGRPRWRVDERPHGGQRTFATRDRAEEAAHVARLTFGNRAAAPLPLADHVEAVRALELLRPIGGSLLDAAREYAARRLTGNEPASVALPSWLEEREAAVARGELSAGQAKNARWAVKAFRGSPLADLPLREVTATAGEEWLLALDLGRDGRDGLRRQLRAAWGWLARKGRAGFNPWSAVELPRAKAAEVSILTPLASAALLLACRPSPPVWRYALAGLALGLRPSEAARMVRAHFRDGHLEVAGHKTGQRRFLALQPALWAAFTGNPAQDAAPAFPGQLLPGVLRREWREARDRAGVSVPPDALRHSFASYWLPVHADRARLAEWMGNSVAIIGRHYRRPVPESAAREFWAAIDGEVATAFSDTTTKKGTAP